MTAIPLSPADYLPHLSRLVAEFERFLRMADLEAPVESCGTWRLRDLGTHLGNVHRWAESIVVTGEVSPQDFETDPGGDLADWYAEAAAGLLTTLRAVNPSEASWTLSKTERVKAFWFRRQTQEVLVHLFDAARAAGAESKMEPLLAADGVDEVLGVMMPRVHHKSGPPPLPESLLIRATDTGNAWLLRPAAVDGEGPIVRRVSGEMVSAATVAAPAEDLLLALWKRRGVAEVAPRITGDESIAHGFLAAKLTP
ncbi:MAG: hypothetical protein QOI21_3625 [Actinomycetota bacterium]|jgi:uncharacterized protein (TIGR03083 family)|nr:hypothetical protein [Actinomycetota bacterium]